MYVLGVTLWENVARYICYILSHLSFRKSSQERGLKHCASCTGIWESDTTVNKTVHNSSIISYKKNILTLKC